MKLAPNPLDDSNNNKIKIRIRAKIRVSIKANIRDRKRPVVSADINNPFSIPQRIITAALSVDHPYCPFRRR